LASDSPSDVKRPTIQRTIAYGFNANNNGYKRSRTSNHTPETTFFHPSLDRQSAPNTNLIVLARVSEFM